LIGFSSGLEKTKRLKAICGVENCLKGISGQVLKVIRNSRSNDSWWKIFLLFGLIVFWILFFEACEVTSRRKHTAAKWSASLASLAQRIESVGNKLSGLHRENFVRTKFFSWLLPPRIQRSWSASLAGLAQRIESVGNKLSGLDWWWGVASVSQVRRLLC
jgi:hypothetical protein